MHRHLGLRAIISSKIGRNTSWSTTSHSQKRLGYLATDADFWGWGALGFVGFMVTPADGDQKGVKTNIKPASQGWNLLFDWSAESNLNICRLGTADHQFPVLLLSCDTYYTVLAMESATKTHVELNQLGLTITWGCTGCRYHLLR